MLVARMLRESWLSWKIKRTPCQRDVPNYKAFPLRPRFLTIIFLFICGLTIVLEYLLRTLPNEHERNSIPHDFPYTVVQRRQNNPILESYSQREQQTSGRYPLATP